jgi:glutamate N-acetyltransferase/amino-acid N-acetyltransferase
VTTDNAWKEIPDGTVCSPRGYRAAGVSAHIKNLQSTKKDCALLVSDAPATVAGTFTTNLLKAPPIKWTEGVCIRGEARALFINSGNANACTGGQGARDVQETAEALCLALDIPMTEVCVLSTGVIGVPLPMDRIHNGMKQCLEALSPAGGLDATQAIMTTDTVPKHMAVEVPLSTGTVRIGAMTKGSGMIAPNMATMFGIITTDATITSDTLQPLLREKVGRSFNQICVDNDMSTSDAVLCFANGMSETPTLEEGTEDYQRFADALEFLCVAMAQALVKDGEGATKFVEIQVTGTLTDDEARTIARAIAMSQLCKTAFAGEDPNWGRIACAAGYAGVTFMPERLAISLNEVEVVHEGLPTEFLEEDAAAVMQLPEFVISVSIGDGPGKSTFWTSDLTHDYVTINADYRT